MVALTDVPQPPRQLGRYAMYGAMATGGMASVHLGRLLGSAGFARTVVIKRMLAELAANPEFVAMFVDEARLASRVQHPNVVSTLDVVRDDQELFIVMEYVHGESLEQLIQASAKRDLRIPPRIVAALGVQALLGLHAAHEALSDVGEPLHLVHRDFTPHNLLVDVDGAARVMDFGVAKATQKQHKTRDGQVKGKWAYMSPEQVAGEDLDRRSDVFAAGIVLWEALTCSRLFDHENAARVATDITYKQVEAPSIHAPDCPPELDAVVLKALEKEAGDRYADAREMAQALRRAQAPADVLDVSAWLEDIAGDVLAARAKEVAAIERASASMVAIPKSGAISLIDSSVTGSLRDAITSALPPSSPRSPSAARSSSKPTLASEPPGASTLASEPPEAAPTKLHSADAVAKAREAARGEPDEIARVVREVVEKAAASDQLPPTRSSTPAPVTPSERAGAVTRPQVALRSPRPAKPPESAATREASDSAPDAAELASLDDRTTPDSADGERERARRRLFIGVVLLLITIASVVVLAQKRSSSDAGPPAPASAG